MTTTNAIKTLDQHELVSFSSVPFDIRVLRLQMIQCINWPGATEIKLLQSLCTHYEVVRQNICKDCGATIMDEQARIKKVRKTYIANMKLACDLRQDVQQRLWALQELCEHPNRLPSSHPMHYAWECADCGKLEMDRP